MTLLSRAIAMALSTALAGTRVAGADCQPPVGAPAIPETSEPSAEAQADPSQIDFQADSVEAQRDGEMLLKGEVVITQGERRLKTRDAVYDQQSESLKITHPVEYSDPDLKVSGASAQVQQVGAATFEQAQFELRERGARGSARRIRATREGELSLDGVRYTTCPIGNEDWVLKASDIDIDQRAGFGVGRGVRLDFKGIPILYTPLISFPVSVERKSGFLFPTIGTSSRSGYSLSTPWYWNIAPNYDATFTPTWFSKRGGKLDSEFRFLTALGRGKLETEFLPSDQEAGEQRSLLKFTERSELSRHLRLDIDAANASDSQWFEDFGLGPEGTSISYLNRSAQLTYLRGPWHAVLRAQNFQTIDDLGIEPVRQPDPLLPAIAQRPHSLVPQMAVHAAFPEQPFGLTFGFDLEVAGFEHNYSELVDTGWRLDLAPQIRMPLRGAGLYLEPAASWRYTTYRLDDVATGRDDAPARSAPIVSVDGGMVFERLWGSKQQLLHTIEPRFMYLRVPFREQDDLPILDTGAADLNLVQLFRTNRYVGADRLSDADQLAVGFTSRLLDADSGKQFITGTIGQAYYFSTPRVALPGERLEDPEFSDIIAELDLTAYGNWNIGMGVQWDPGETRSEKGDIQLQYKPAHDQVANIGYRFRRGSVEQVDGSAAWPIGRDWSAYARLVYSLEERQSLDQFAGLEYRSCCWRMRLVARRYVSDRTGDMDTSFLLQLELNGLSSVGVGADAFLEGAIRGYSAGSAEP